METATIPGTNSKVMIQCGSEPPAEWSTPRALCTSAQADAENDESRTAPAETHGSVRGRQGGRGERDATE